MTTHLIRHARTDYSSRYLVNGDPGHPLPLDEEGVRTCHTTRSSLPTTSVRTWVASAFPRAQQTAVLLRDASVSPLLIEPLLNELDYGDFEGAPFLDYAAWLQRHGPWVRPPGAGESQREGIQRMLCGLSATLEQSGPRVVVAHGLLLSVLGWHLSCAPGTAIPLFFPEAVHLAPLTMADGPLGALVDRLLVELDSQSRREPRPPRGDAAIWGMEAASILATVDSLPTPLEEKPPHA